MQFKIKGILSYPHLITPRAIEAGAEPKYSVTVLVKDDDPQLQTVLQIIEQEKANGFPSGFPDTGKLCCKPSKEYPGWHQISGNAKADQKPHLVDAAMQPVLDQATVYAGAVAWVQFNTFVYNQPINKGIGAGLNGVMMTGEEGELGRIDGKPTVESMFGDVAGGMAPPQQPAAPAPAAATPAPAPQAPPAAPAPAPTAGLIMTAAANGMTYQQYKDAGWSDEQMIANGIAQKPSFA